MSKESERQTRAQRIDPKLDAADWAVAAFTSEQQARQLKATAIEEYPTANGPADYALVDRGCIRAVVEAKKVTLGPQGVLTQAERYSKGLHQVPMYQGE